MSEYEINKHDVLIKLRIWGCESQEEAENEIKKQVENGLWVQGISGTSVLTVVSIQSEVKQ